jgi:L-2,4-diaminobutyrate decarboxylase
MSLLSEIYDSDLWQKQASEAVEELSQVLRGAPRKEGFALKSPEVLKAIAFEALSQNKSKSSFSDSLRTVLEEARILHSPRYMGHQVSAPFPIAGIGQMLVKTLNQANAVYEMSPFSVAVEKVLLEKLSEKLGWDGKESGGVITSGGSVGNLTALTTARNLHFPHFWKTGTLGLSRKPAIVTSGDSHYSISRAAGILGVGAENVFKAPLDAKRRLDPSRLEKFILNLKEEGFDVFAVVATSGSTPVGSFDSLDEIATIAQKLGLWFHVDGAHGASVVFSEKYRSLVKGIEKADSVVWDAHKMMAMPAILTFVLYRKGESAYRTFQQDAPYLLDSEDRHKREFDNGIRTLECTKSAEILALWLAWSTYGENSFSDYLEACFEKTRSFYELLKSSSDFEVNLEPQANILCFRYLPGAWKSFSPDEINREQKRIRETLVKEGKFYISHTTFDGISSSSAFK